MIACGESDSSYTADARRSKSRRYRPGLTAFKVRVIHFQQVIDFTLFNLHCFGSPLYSTSVVPMMENSSIPGSRRQYVYLRFAECRPAFVMNARHDNMAAFDQANAIRRSRCIPSSKNCFTHGPVAFTRRALASYIFCRYRYLPLPQSTAVFAASRSGTSTSKHFTAFTTTIWALASTRRASSTQQSEFQIRA